MPFRSLVLRLALLAGSTLLALSGCDCGRQCTVPSDCSPPQTCEQGRCVDNPDSGPTCSPACPIGQFCDTVSLTCKICDATFIPGSQINTGCVTTQPVCDTTANGGRGQCRSCAPTSTDGGTDQGCGGMLPVCNPVLGSGNGACVTCTGRGGCGNGRVCDTSTDGGACRTCIASTDGGLALGCTAAEPICNQSFNQGAGRCLVCNADAGCTGGTICDPAANGSKGVCDYCRPSSDGGVAPGCAAGSPVCDPARDAGLGACIVCNAGAGCSGGTICDAAANGGSGACKNCYAAPGSPDPGCNSGSPVCDAADAGGLGSCVGCLSSGDCSTPPNLVCDPAVDRCKVCITMPAPEGCNAGQTCNPLANGGQGVCEGCTTDLNCLLPDGGAGAQPHCLAAPPPGVCVECVSTPDCTNPIRPLCNASNICGCTANADCLAPGSPICDTAANSGNGVCVQCTPTQGCGGDTPFCSNNICICRDNSDCPVGKECRGSPASCQPVDLSGAQGGIDAFNDAGAGAVSIPIDGAYVTYFKPAIGTFTSDPPGFFVQAQAAGGALYVATDPTLLSPDGGAVAVGARVQFTVLNKANIGTTQMTAAMLSDGGVGIAGLSVLSTGHPVGNLSTATPAGLVTDISAAADVVSNIPRYQARLIQITGTVDAGFVTAGTAHVGAIFPTAGFPTGPGLQLRLPDTFPAQLELSQGCHLTVRKGPMWRFQATAQPSSYLTGDINILSCPGPKVVAADPLSDTSVEVTFNRSIDPASVAPTDFDIAGLVITSASVAGTKVVLTTSTQTPDQAYTVTVTGITDTLGDPNDLTANSYLFHGYLGPQAGIVINEIDYDQTGTDTAEFLELANISTGPISLGGLQVVLVNGGNTTTPRREYLRFRLDQVTDGTNPVYQFPAGGVVVLGSTVVTAALPAGTLRMTIKANSATPDSNIIQNGGIMTAPESDGLGVIHYATGTLLDALFYEASTQSATFTIATGQGDKTLVFEEGTRTQFEDTVTGSVERKKTGVPAAPQDTNDNNADFQIATTPSPGTL